LQRVLCGFLVSGVASWLLTAPIGAK
jgi:hypothetical protein